MTNFKPGLNREEKIDKFLDNLAWFHSQKDLPTGFFQTIGEIRNALFDLNKNIKDSNETSTNLSKALNRITLAGSIIAAIGLVLHAIELFKLI